MMARRTWMLGTVLFCRCGVGSLCFWRGSNVLVRNALHLLATKVLGAPFHCESFWSARGLLSSSGPFSTAAGLWSPRALEADQELRGWFSYGMLPQLYRALLPCLGSAQSRLAITNPHGFVVGGKMSVTNKPGLHSHGFSDPARSFDMLSVNGQRQKQKGFWTLKKLVF